MSRSYTAEELIALIDEGIIEAEWLSASEQLAVEIVRSQQDEAMAYFEAQAKAQTDRECAA